MAQTRCLAVVLAAGAIAACNQPRLRNFLPPGARFERTFGQLFDDAGTLKPSHYAVLALTPPEARAIANGTIEYQRAFDGMGNCLLLRPKKHFSTPNDFSKLEGLPKPGGLVVAYCNLDEPSVRTAVEALYTARLSAAEAPPATTKFLDHDPSFTRVDVTAHETNLAMSTKLGDATGGKLSLAAFVEREGVRHYVNPMPYLAGALPAASLDAVAPTLDEVILETSASGTFGGDRVSHTPAGGVISGQVSRTWLRVAIRATERTASGAALVVPYRVRYKLSRLMLSGTTVVSRDERAKGTLLANQVTVADAALLAATPYGTSAPILSNATSGPYWLLLGWPSPVANGEETTANLFDAALARKLDLAAAPGGTPSFPSGSYELEVTVEDAANASTSSATQAIRFELAPGAAAPGDSVLSYGPTSGPLGTEVTVTSATSGAFASDTTVEFTGAFDPDGLDLAGTELPPTSSFTITYPSTKVTVIDGQTLKVRIGEVLPGSSILSSATLRLASSGRLLGDLRVRTTSTGFDHTTPSVSFNLIGSVRFGQVVSGAFTETEPLPLASATTTAQLAATPDFDRLVIEWRVPAPASPPPTVTVIVKTVNASGAALDSENHELAYVETAAGIAVYRSHTRRVVLVTSASLSGPMGSDLLGVHADPGGAIRLDGVPPP